MQRNKFTAAVSAGALSIAMMGGSVALASSAQAGIIDKPVISTTAASSTISATVGQAITPFTVSATDVDGISRITVTGLPAGVTYNAATKTVSGTPTVKGTYTVVITAFDGLGQRSQRVLTMTVSAPAPAPVNQAPVIAPVQDVTVEAGQEISPIAVSATDDSMTTPTIVVSGLPQGLEFDAATGQITGTTTVVGAHTVTITATDDQSLTSTSTFTLTVADTTDPALTVSTTTVAATTGSAITPVAISATDNSGQPATIAVTGLPDWLVYDNGQITGTPTTAGNATATVTATDASGNVSTQQITITVTDPEVQPTP